VALVAVSCNEDPSDIPEISNLTVLPMVVQEFTDSVTILQNADLYHVIPLSPEGSNVPIQGKLTVQLNNLFILGNDTLEELQFEVMMQDQKGNWSNLLESDTISVYRP
jgi:hypothetical protein